MEFNNFGAANVKAFSLNSMKTKLANVTNQKFGDRKYTSPGVLLQLRASVGVKYLITSDHTFNS